MLNESTITKQSMSVVFFFSLLLLHKSILVCEGTVNTDFSHLFTSRPWSEKQRLINQYFIVFCFSSLFYLPQLWVFCHHNLTIYSSCFISNFYLPHSNTDPNSVIYLIRTKNSLETRPTNRYIHNQFTSKKKKQLERLHAPGISSQNFHFQSFLLGPF